MALSESLCPLRMSADPMEGFVKDFEDFEDRSCDLNGTQVLMSRLYEAILGRQPEPATLRQYHFAVTVLYLFTTINLARLMRLCTKVAPTLARPLLMDAITTFQTISCGFENGFVRKVYGTGAYCCQTFCLGLWSSWTVGKESSGNPVTNFKHFFVRKFGFSRTLLHMSVQMLSGLVAYQYASRFWELGLSQEHTSKLVADEHCVADLNVPVFLGFFIELSATIVDTVVSRTTTKRFLFEHYEQFAKGIFSIWMTLLGLNLTGMYLNPANATARTFSCAGVSKMEFIFVYWLGPIIGSAIGIVLHQNFTAAVQILSTQLNHGKSMDSAQGLNVDSAQGKSMDSAQGKSMGSAQGLALDQAGQHTNTQNPATSSQNPATSSQNPATSSQNPATSSQNPAMSSQNPATSSQNSSHLSNDSGFVEDSVTLTEKKEQ